MSDIREQIIKKMVSPSHPGCISYDKAVVDANKLLNRFQAKIEYALLGWVVENVDVDCRGCIGSKECYKNDTVPCADILMQKYVDDTEKE